MKKRKKIFLVLLGESSEKKVKRKNPRGDKRFSRLKTKAAPNGASSLSKWPEPCLQHAAPPLKPRGEMTPEESPDAQD